MKSLADQMCIYHLYHKKRSNIITHMVGIPMILFGAMVLLGWVKIVVPGYVHLSLTWFLLAPLLLYYFYLDLSLASIMTVILCVFALIADRFTLQGPSVLSLWLFIVFFGGGWIIQFIGHLFEGKRPAFMDNFWQLIIGPLFLLAEVFFMLGYRKDLECAIKQPPSNDLC